MFRNLFRSLFTFVICFLPAPSMGFANDELVPYVESSSPIYPNRSDEFSTPVDYPISNSKNFSESVDATIGKYVSLSSHRTRSYNVETVMPMNSCVETGCLRTHSLRSACFPKYDYADYSLLEPAYDDSSTRFFIQTEALFLQRDNNSISQTVIIDDTTMAPVMSTQDLGFDTNAGIRVLGGWQVNQYNTIEFSYFGTHFWDSTRTFLSTASLSLSLPGDIGMAMTDFDTADAMDVRYSSRLHNIEANIVHRVYYFDLLAGFRYIIMDEEFNIQSTTGSDTSDYNIKTANDLYGGQIGAHIKRYYNRFFWSATGKVGVFMSENHQSTFLGNVGNTVTLRDRSAETTSTSFVGEIGLNAGYRFSDVWSVAGGYNMMWISTVALAPDQLDFTNTMTSSTTIDSSGSVFYHGANVRLEARW